MGRYGVTGGVREAQNSEHEIRLGVSAQQTWGKDVWFGSRDGPILMTPPRKGYARGR